MTESSTGNDGPPEIGALPSSSGPREDVPPSTEVEKPAIAMDELPFATVETSRLKGLLSINMLPKELDKFQGFVTCKIISNQNVSIFNL